MYIYGLKTILGLMELWVVDMKTLALFVMLALCAVAFADSDAIGVIAGTVETLPLALYNSSHGLDANGSCNISVYNNIALMINQTQMVNNGNGIYSYEWAVPEEAGSYRILMACTNSEGANVSAGGALHVSVRSFEKTVARSVVQSSPKIVAAVSANWWEDPGRVVGAVVLIVMLVGAGVYIYDRILYKIGRG